MNCRSKLACTFITVNNRIVFTSSAESEKTFDDNARKSELCAHLAVHGVDYLSEGRVRCHFYRGNHLPKVDDHIDDIEGVFWNWLTLDGPHWNWVQEFAESSS